MMQYAIVKDRRKFVDNYTLKVVGHAGYAEIGKDIVCSAVSILVITLAERLRECAERTDAVELYTKLKPGDAYIFCRCPAGQADVEEAFRFASLGLSMTSEEYSKNVILDTSIL